MTDFIPLELGLLHNLESLNRGDFLSGTIPPSIGSLTKLSYLRLLGNSLSGPIPTTLGLLTSLENFDTSFQ